ncbi:hypothetical protein ACYUJ6_09850 [Clostridium sp. JNZ X4-2]
MEDKKLSTLVVYYSLDGGEKGKTFENRKENVVFYWRQGLC